MFQYSRKKKENQAPGDAREEMPVQGSGRFSVRVWDGDKQLLNNRCDTVVVTGFTQPGEITHMFYSGIHGSRATRATTLVHVAMQLQVASREAMRKAIELAPGMTEQTALDLMRDGVERLERVFAEQEAGHADEE